MDPGDWGHAAPEGGRGGRSGSVARVRAVAIGANSRAARPPTARRRSTGRCGRPRRCASILLGAPAAFSCSPATGAPAQSRPTCAPGRRCMRANGCCSRCPGCNARENAAAQCAGRRCKRRHETRPGRAMDRPEATNGSNRERTRARRQGRWRRTMPVQALRLAPRQRSLWVRHAGEARTSVPSPSARVRTRDSPAPRRQAAHGAQRH
jgi:hypothetical protein